MRNLRLLKSLRCSELQGPGTPQCFSVLTDTGKELLVSEYSVTEVDSRAGVVDSYLPENGGGTVVGIQDLPDQESVCVATATGDVILNTNQVSTLLCQGVILFEELSKDTWWAIN
uniref:Uncharacterized protein n=1 Tax=Oncorhynchus mykiss TaxID=8022 RepID=A0A8C7UJ07_ONCMY